MAMLRLGDEACHADDLVAGKAATLSRVAAEFPVPAAIAVLAVLPCATTTAASTSAIASGTTPC